MSASPAQESDAASQSAIVSELACLRRRIAWLVVGVFALAAALLLTVAAVFGAVIDFHYGEGKLIGGACAGGVALGFAFGWLAGRSA